MAPKESTTAAISSSNSLFTSVSRDGFPAPKQTSQKWKQLGLPEPTSNKRPEDDTKMLVLCSLRHDYGKSFFLRCWGTDES